MKSKSPGQSKSALTRRSGRGRKKITLPRTAQEYSAKPLRFQGLWDRVVEVISKLRSQKTSLRQTAREVGVDPRTVVRLGGSALKKDSRGCYQAKKTDRLLRMLMVPTSEGASEIAVRDSRHATVLGEYWNAVHRYLATGDASGIKKFEGRQITDADGKHVALLTNLAELDRLGSAGVMTFESIYGKNA